MFNSEEQKAEQASFFYSFIQPHSSAVKLQGAVSGDYTSDNEFTPQRWL